jgi:hypothetical protein
MAVETVDITVNEVTESVSLNVSEQVESLRFKSNVNVNSVKGTEDRISVDNTDPYNPILNIDPAFDIAISQQIEEAVGAIPAGDPAGSAAAAMVAAEAYTDEQVLSGVESANSYTDTVAAGKANHNKRVVSVSSSATPTVNADVTDIARITSLATAVTNMSTNLSGTFSHGQFLCYEITDNGTARALAWGTSFAATTSIALPTTTVISTLGRYLFQYNSATSKFEIVGSI